MFRHAILLFVFACCAVSNKTSAQSLPSPRASTPAANDNSGFPASTALEAGAVRFQRPETGSVLRTLDAMLRDIPLSIKEFGAIMDGVTDDTPAFNKAVAALLGKGAVSW